MTIETKRPIRTIAIADNNRIVDCSMYIVIIFKLSLYLVSKSPKKKTAILGKPDEDSSEGESVCFLFSEFLSIVTTGDKNHKKESLPKLIRMNETPQSEAYHSMCE